MKSKTSNWSWVLAALALGIGIPAFVALMVTLRSPLGGSPDYSTAERGFLSQLHHSKWVWSDDDAELLRQGHQVCRLLDGNGGNETVLEEPQLFSHGPDPMPGFMKKYNSLDQRHELVVASTVHFCDEYTLYIGNVPI